MPDRKDKASRKLKGFRTVPKGFALEARKNGVSAGAFWFFNLLVDLSDWDPDHIFTYGKIDFSVLELSEKFGVSDSSIYRQYKHELLKAGLIKFENRRFWIENPERFNTKKSAKAPQNPEEMQERAAKVPGIVIVGQGGKGSIYKGHIRGSISNKNERVSEDEIPF